jgi:hypothetical protein
MATLQSFIRELPHFNIGRNTDRSAFVIYCFPLQFLQVNTWIGKGLLSLDTSKCITNNNPTLPHFIVWDINVNVK